MQNLSDYGSTTNGEILQHLFKINLAPRDVVLSSYPKCDTKIAEIILYKLMMPTAQLPKPDDVTNRLLPLLEADDQIRLEMEHTSNRGKPRLLKTELPFHMIYLKHHAKFVYIVRNPWDASVANYRNMRINGQLSETFDDYLGLFGTDFFRHVSAWNSNIEEKNVLVLPYEGIKTNPRVTLWKMATFLGEPYLNLALQRDDVVQDILKHVAFDKERSSPEYKRKKAHMLGDKPVLTETQMKTFRSKMNLYFENTSIGNYWKNLHKMTKEKRIAIDFLSLD